MSPTLGRYAFIGLGLILFSGIGSAAAQTALSASDAGRRLYEQGITTNGSALKALWPGGVTRSGEAAACLQCHRPSGMGMWEGSVLVPPVTGFHLFAARLAPRHQAASRPGAWSTRIITSTPARPMIDDRWPARLSKA